LTNSVVNLTSSINIRSVMQRESRTAAALTRLTDSRLSSRKHAISDTGPMRALVRGDEAVALALNSEGGTVSAASWFIAVPVGSVVAVWHKQTACQLANGPEQHGTGT
jgi:hypothetical protein